MYIIRISLSILLTLQITCLVHAAENPPPLDKPGAASVQKKSTDVSGTSQDDSKANQPFPSMNNADSQKASKDTSLNLTGNGGSSNRSAGGNAMLRKRFTF
jgi:hypothetical protein